MVVDSGKARRAEFDPGTGMARLVTTRVSKHEAPKEWDAGRVAAGKCYKFWSQPEDGGMSLSSPAEMEADLSSRFGIGTLGSRGSRLASPPITRLAGRSVIVMLSAEFGWYHHRTGKALANCPCTQIGSLLAKAGKNAYARRSARRTRRLSREAPKIFLFVSIF